MKALSTLITVDNAIKLLANYLKELVILDVETVNVLDAVGRVLAEDVYASIDRPEEDISAVDGYAVNSLDTTGASYYNPVRLAVKVVYDPLKKQGNLCVEPGTAIKVHTGWPLPCNANAVVMSEDVEVKNGFITVHRPVAAGTNVIYRGEDFKRGELLATRGTVIKPPLIAALAASGIDKVKVYRKINISIIAIGDELVEPGKEKAPGKVYDSSSYIVFSMMQKDGVFNVKYPNIVRDDVNELEDAVLREFERGVDVVVTTGGTGISESDIIADFVEKRGKFIFRGVRMRPGRPTSSSVLDHKYLLIHFSGFPVAAWAGYEVLFRMAVIEWLGIRGLDRLSIYARLSRRVPNVVGYKSIVRVAVFEHGGEFYAEPYMLRGSGVISSLLRTNGYVIIPEDVEGFEENTRVKVYMYE